MDLAEWEFELTADNRLRLLLAPQNFSELDYLIEMLAWDFEEKATRGDAKALRWRYGLTMLHLSNFQLKYSNGDPLPGPALDVHDELTRLTGGGEPGNNRLTKQRRRVPATDQAYTEILAVILIELYRSDYPIRQDVAFKHVADLLLKGGFWASKGQKSRQGEAGVKSWWDDKKKWGPDSEHRKRYDAAMKQLDGLETDKKIAAIEVVLRGIGRARKEAREWAADRY